MTFDDDHGRLRFTSETCSYRQRVPLRLHDAACYTDRKFNENYTSCRKFSLEIVKLQRRLILKLARLHEIAKINTRKIVTIAKSQNFVLANNSNNKVMHPK